MSTSTLELVTSETALSFRGGAVSAPSQGSAVSAPSHGGAVSAPSQGRAVSAPSQGGAVSAPGPLHILPIPWRDPQTVSKAELAKHIRALELACDANPGSADLHTCLGMAYAMNYEAYRSMDVLQAAVGMDETHFFAQFKLAELYYRLRTLPNAEEETLKAVNLAGNGWELNMARKQLQEIRRLIREGSQRPELNKPLKQPLIAFGILSAICFAIVAFTK